jgi:hypothetical protein
MPTSNSNPTAGEITQNDVPDGTTETNFPAEDPTQPTENPVVEKEDGEEVGPGEIWAIYKGLQPSERILTVADLKSLGDKNAKEELRWDANNRFRLEVSGAHRMVLDYLENVDSAFEIVRA